MSRPFHALIVVALVGFALLGARPALSRRQATPTPTAGPTRPPGATPSATGATGATGATTQTIVAVGDSITAGDWDTYVAGGWVTRLANKLRIAYPKTPFVVRNAGVDGDTTAGVLARLAHDVLAARPQLVIVSIGTNDFDYHVPPATFAARLRTVVDRLHTAPHAPVIILASMLPIASQTPRQLAAERSYNDVIRQTAAAKRVGYLDLFGMWLALGDQLMRTLRHDTEHPNPIGYELLADTTAAFLEAAYLDKQGRIVNPAQPPTCSPALCG